MTEHSRQPTAKTDTTAGSVGFVGETPSPQYVEPAYLTAQQVADLLQLDEKTILRWSLQDASMPALRRRRVVRFPRQRLLVWLERQEPRAARRSSQAQRKGAPDAP